MNQGNKLVFILPLLQVPGVHGMAMQCGEMSVLIYNPFSTEHLTVFYNVQMTKHMYV